MAEMGLPPLEYTECYLDSPVFRETIALYEKELEENARDAKTLVKECRLMIQATEGMCCYAENSCHMYVATFQTCTCMYRLASTHS